MKKYLLLLALVCLLGNRGLAQTYPNEPNATIDFENFSEDWGIRNCTWVPAPVVDPSTGQTIQWGDNVKKT